MTKKPSKKVNTPSDTKAPRGGAKVVGVPGEVASWHLGVIDWEGPFGWGACCLDTVWGDILPRLASFETMRWSEIEGKQNHAIPVDEIAPEARKRLAEIGQSDVDELFSLRLQGRPRIWGIRDRHILKILWWDPDHRICPAPKKRT